MSQVFKIVTREFPSNRITTQEEVLKENEIHQPRFILTFYVNNQVTSIVESVRAPMAYDMGVPPEALEYSDQNRWHVLMRNDAIIKMLQDNSSEEIVLAFQTPIEGYDTERITAKRFIALN
jgi:hypothetical protein